MTNKSVEEGVSGGLRCRHGEFFLKHLVCKLHNDNQARIMRSNELFGLLVSRNLAALDCIFVFMS